MEERLSITPWGMPPNENNDVLRRGCQKLGFSSGAIRRNVKGCANLGYCGMGCPLNAKQSMLVTTIPRRSIAGATLVHRAPVTRLVLDGDKVVACEARGVERNGAPPGNARVRIRARHFVLAAGRHRQPRDPARERRARSQRHPRQAHLPASHRSVSGAVFPQKVEGYYGAPQTIYSDHFLDALALDGPIGFKLEAPPVHPILAGITLPGYGADHAAWMKRFPHLQVLIALMRDGFHDESPGGQVVLRGGWPTLDYPITDYVWNGVRRAYLAMAEIQFARGAQSVMPLHEGRGTGDQLARGAHRDRGTPPQAAARARRQRPRDGRLRDGQRPQHLGRQRARPPPPARQLLGARRLGLPDQHRGQPQLSIYAQAGRMATTLAQRLKA
jgi:hypothetical protein